MKTCCPGCGYHFETQIAPGLKNACPKCMAEFLQGTVRIAIPTPGDKPPLEIGSTIRGMKVLECLGQGGMGFVYKARQLELDRIVAVKVLAPRLADSPDFALRFNREAKALATLNHPNIVQVFDFGKEGDLYFIVMEFVDGASLRELLRAQRFTSETALRYIPQICDALEYAHAKGIVHRDIKPENILVDQQGKLKIVDFGLAKMIMPTDDVQNLSMTGTAMGTPHYMAPEQYEGGKVDYRADIYSLGVVFYEMLTGELPVGKFPMPSQKLEIDVRYDDVVLKALEKNPQRRYQHAEEIKTDITSIGDSHQTARPVPPTVHEGSAAPSRKWPIGILACCAAVLLATSLPWSSIKGKVGGRGEPGFYESMGVKQGSARYLDGFRGFSGVYEWNGIPDGYPVVSSVVTIRANGWRTNLQLFGQDIPNWLTVVAALGIAVFVLLRTMGVWQPPRLTLCLLSGYGLLHAGLFAFAVTCSTSSVFKHNAGLGVLIATVSFGAMLVLLTEAWRKLMLILISLGLLVILIALPIYVNHVSAMSATRTAKDAYCLNNLRQIEFAKAHAAGDNGYSSGTTIPGEVLVKYLNVQKLTCPKGGTYVINPVGTAPACSIHGSLPEFTATVLTPKTGK